MSRPESASEREALEATLRQNHDLFEAVAQQAQVVAETAARARDLTGQVLRFLGTDTPDRS
ncbi:hypothetical protein LUW77_03350 [Streptomyces radiopugnans]|nr:hypothetical protein LUW77_03350 [Streptomyces radiopugnans]